MSPAATIALWKRIGIYAAAALVLLYSLGPFLWIFIASITPETKAEWGAISGRGVTYLPTQPTLQNYVDLLNNTPFLLYFRNSVIIATGNMILTLLVASLGAYGFVRFHFAGRGPLLVGMLIAYTIPSVVLLVPLLVELRSFGLVNTHLGMILAEATHSAPFVLLPMINCFTTRPRERDAAAQVAGIPRPGQSWRIIIPLSVPGLVAGGLLAFIMTWNNFLFAFLFTTTNAVKPLPVMMRLFAMGEPAVWSISAAGAVLTTLPVALIFLLFQRMLMSGLAAGAVKG